MIVSYKHNYIFIKTRKTAGSSIEIALSASVGEMDVVTPMGTDDELERQRIVPGAVPQNYSTALETEAYFAEVLRKGSQRAMKAVRKQRLDRSTHTFTTHMGAAEAKPKLDPAFWDNAFKFTVDRHPYEKAVSLAYFRIRNDPDKNFDKVLDRIVDNGKYRNYDLYSIDGTMIADFVMKYENLTEDLARIERRLGGVEIQKYMAKSKGNFRQDRREARDILSDNQKATIQKICKEEFGLFDYER